MMTVFDYKRKVLLKKNHKWNERLLPVLFLVFILLGIFSLNISQEVKKLTNNLDKFYNHSYQVENAGREFNLGALEIASIWSGHYVEKYSASEIKPIIKRKFTALDSSYVLIKEKYLGETGQVKALEEAYLPFKNYINTTGFNDYNLNHDDSNHEEINLLLVDIIHSLKPIESFAAANTYLSKNRIEESVLHQKLNQLYILVTLGFVIGLFLTLYLLINKNRVLFNEQEKYIKAIEYAPVPMMIHKNGAIKQISDEWLKQTGYSREEIRTVEEWCKKAYRDDYKTKLEIIFKKYGLETIQEDGVWEINTKSGERILWKIRSGPLGNGYIFSTAVDFTEEHKKQQQIEKLYGDKLRLAMAVDQSPASIMITDTKGNIEYVSNYFTELTGYSSDEVKGKNPSILKSGVQSNEYYKDLWETISRGDVWTGELQNKAKDGTVFWELASIYPIIDTNGKIINYVSVKENITEKKYVQEALVKSEKKYRDLFTRSTDACLILKGGVYTDCNDAALKALGMSSKEELIGLRPSQIAPEFQENGVRSDSEAIKKLTKASEEKHLRFEWLHKKVNGEIAPFEVMLTKIEEGGEDDDDDYFYVVWRDIKARKEFEKQLKENLEEKEVLLSEVHHRVKNNLAIISGLLELQIFSSEDPKVLEVLGLSVQRIKTIAIIHEQIYNSGDFTAISIDESIKSEIENMLKKYNISGENEINVNYDVENIKLNVNQAIPFGLLINELVTSSVKHSLAGIKNPSFEIYLHHKDGVIEFRIHVNGVGFDVNDFNSSLVKNLISVFVSQLDGNLDVKSSPEKGTSITLTFKPTIKKGSSSNLVNI